MLDLDLYLDNSLNGNWVVESMSLLDALNQRSSVKFKYLKKDAVNPESHMTAELKADSTTIFKGTIEQVNETDSLDNPYITADIECVDYNQVLDRRQVAAIYENMTFKAIVQDINTNFLDGEGITADSYVSTGPLFNKIIFDYVSVTEAFEYLSGLTGYFYYIDESKELHFADMENSAHAPFDIGVNDANYISMTKVQNRQDYRNVQYLKGGNQTLSARTESFVGDSKRRTFNIAFPFAEEPSSVTVNSTAKTVGVKGIDTGKDWYWQKESKELVQDDAGTLLTSSDVLTVTYKGLLPIFIAAQNEDEIDRVKALEGGSGKYEMSESDEMIEDLSLATSKTQSLLRKFAKRLTEVTFTTRKHGLHSGQTITVYNNKLNLDKSYLITEVSAQVNGYNEDDWFIEYTVSLSDAEIFSMWQHFYIGLLNATRAKMSIDNQAITYLRYKSEIIQFADTLVCTDSITYEPEWDSADHDFSEFGGVVITPDELEIIYNETADYAAGSGTDVVIADDKIVLDTELTPAFTADGSYYVTSMRKYYFTAQDDDYVYTSRFDASTSPQTSVEKFQKSDMTRVAYYSGTYLGAVGIAVHGEYVYVAYQASGKLVKFNKSDLSYVAELSIASCRNCLLDTTGDYLWTIGVTLSYHYIYKIQLSDFTSLGSKKGHFYDGYDFMWQDNDYVYHNIRSINTSYVGRYSKDLSTYEEISFSGTSKYSQGGFCLDGYCYILSSSGSDTLLYQHSTSTWSGTATLLATFTGYSTPRDMQYDGNYAYFVLNVSPGKVYRLNMDDYSTDLITLDTNHNLSYSLSLSEKHLAVGCVQTSSYGNIDLIEIATEGYVLSGSFEDALNIYISGDKVYTSAVTWTETLPTGTNIKVYGKLTVGGSWSEISNGSSFQPDIIDKDISADPTTVYWKAVLETTDSTATPEFLGITFHIEGVPL